MHIPAGFWKDGMGDIDVISYREVLHVFYLSIPSHDRVGHMTSIDGLTWTEEQAAIYTGKPGEPDDDQIWTMGVFQHKGKFFMLYTGIAMKERGKVQRVCLATSDDLYNWIKFDGNPVACADPRWYEAAADSKHRVDWRDPWVFPENGILHGIISARSNKGPANRRGCAGHFISKNGFDWIIKPPLCVPGTCYDFETPSICKINNRYYLTGIAGKSTESEPLVPSVFRVAEQVEGPYRRIGHDDLLPGDNQVFKPCLFKGKTLYFHNLSGIADWDGGAHRRVTCLPPPKVADADPEGALVLRPFKSWEAVAKGDVKKFKPSSLPSAGRATAGKWQVSSGILKGGIDSGFSAFLLKEKYGCMILESEINCWGAKEFGIIMRGVDKGDDATYVSFTPALHRVQLFTLQPCYKTPCAGVTYRWRGRRIVQQSVSPDTWKAKLTIRVVAYGPYVEVSVNEQVHISAVTMRRISGQTGFFAEDGHIGVAKLEIRKLNEPACVKTSV